MYYRSKHTKEQHEYLFKKNDFICYSSRQILYEMGSFFLYHIMPYLIYCYRYEDGHNSLSIWPGCHQMSSNIQQKQYNIK